MQALIVVSHPDPGSLSHAVATRLADGVARAGHGAEIADLMAEGFDPRFSAADLKVHRERMAPPADVAAEQARIDRSDRLVLVYPIYWWSVPGLLKGWIDRVFVNGWAYDEGPEIGLVKKLRHLNVHLVGIGGADERTYARHGYFGAMKTQIDHGIFDYCGARVVRHELLLGTGPEEVAAHSETARRLGFTLFDDAEARAARAA